MYRSRRTPLSSQPTISSFTPVNLPDVPAAPTILGSAQTPVRGRKRSAGQLETPPSTSKKPKKVPEPKQPKQTQQYKQETGLENQDISIGSPKEKGVPEDEGMRLCQYEPLSNQPDDRGLRQEQASRVSAELSAETTSKLNAFRYRAGTNEDLCNPDQATFPNSRGCVEIPDSQRATYGDFQAKSTNQCGHKNDIYGFGKVYEDHEPEPAMRPSNDRSTLAIIDTTLIEGNWSVCAPMTPKRQAASTESRLTSEEMVQAHGQTGRFDGYEPPLMLPVYGASSPRRFPRAISPVMQATQPVASVGWIREVKDEELLAMCTNHDDLKSTPDMDHIMYHADPMVSRARKTPSLPPLQAPDHLDVDLIDQQEVEATEDEFPMQDEELKDIIQLPAVQESLGLASSFHPPSDAFFQTNKFYDTTGARSTAGSGRSLRSISKDGECIPTSAQNIVEATNSHPYRRQKSPIDDPYARSYFGRANDTQINFDQQSHDWDFLNQHAGSYFPDIIEAVSDEEYEAVSPSAWESSSKLPMNPPPVYSPDSCSSLFSSVRSSALEAQPSSVMSPRLVSACSAKRTIPTPSRLIVFTADGSPKPFVRPKFPAPIRDRSPILGLNPRSLHRTCFRIGEALNAASAASRANNDVLVELYARVTSSQREVGCWKQHFEFADIFSSEKPPFLSGTYDLWRGVPLWETDSRPFLGEDGKGRLARVIGKVGRDEETKAWKMLILNVWAAGLEDMAWVKGIMCA